MSITTVKESLPIEPFPVYVSCAYTTSVDECFFLSAVSIGTRGNFDAQTVPLQRSSQRPLTVAAKIDEIGGVREVVIHSRDYLQVYALSVRRYSCTYQRGRTYSTRSERVSGASNVLRLLVKESRDSKF